MLNLIIKNKHMRDQQEAMIRLMNGQKKYGRVINYSDPRLVQFVSFTNEQIFGEENSLNYVEEILSEDIREIDFCMK